MSGSPNESAELQRARNALKAFCGESDAFRTAVATLMTPDMPSNDDLLKVQALSSDVIRAAQDLSTKCVKYTIRREDEQEQTAAHNALTNAWVVLLDGIEDGDKDAYEGAAKEIAEMGRRAFEASRVLNGGEC